jgi:hypothetical protein
VGVVVGVSEEVARALPHAPASVIIAVHGRAVLHALTCHVAGPVSVWTYKHAGVGEIVCEHIGERRAGANALVGCVVCVFSQLAITVHHAPFLGHICVFIQWAVAHTLPAGVLRIPAGRAGILAGFITLIAVVVDRVGACASSLAGLGEIVSEIATWTNSKAVTCRVVTIIESGPVADSLADSSCVVSIGSRYGGVWANGNAGPTTVIGIIVRDGGTVGDAGESGVVSVGLITAVVKANGLASTGNVICVSELRDWADEHTSTCKSVSEGGFAIRAGRFA